MYVKNLNIPISYENIDGKQDPYYEYKNVNGVYETVYNKEEVLAGDHRFHENNLINLLIKHMMEHSEEHSLGLYDYTELGRGFSDDDLIITSRIENNQADC